MLVLTSRIDQAHRPGNLGSRKDVGPIDGLSARHRFNPIILKCLLTMDGVESEGRSGIRRRLSWYAQACGLSNDTILAIAEGLYSRSDPDSDGHSRPGWPPQLVSASSNQPYSRHRKYPLQHQM